MAELSNAGQVLLKYIKTVGKTQYTIDSLIDKVHRETYIKYSEKTIRKFLETLERNGYIAAELSTCPLQITITPLGRDIVKNTTRISYSGSYQDERPNYNVCKICGCGRCDCYSENGTVHDWGCKICGSHGRCDCYND